MKHKLSALVIAGMFLFAKPSHATFLTLCEGAGVDVSNSNYVFLWSYGYHVNNVFAANQYALTFWVNVFPSSFNTTLPICYMYWTPGMPLRSTGVTSKEKSKGAPSEPDGMDDLEDDIAADGGCEAFVPYEMNLGPGPSRGATTNLCGALQEIEEHEDEGGGEPPSRQKR